MPELVLPPLTLLLLALFGGWAAVDGTSVGQFGVSRPLVAVLGAGLIVGEPAAVLPLALLLEAAHLSVLPVGAARYPESGPPAVVGAALYAAGPQTPGALLSTLVLVLALEWLSGESIRWLRSVNIRLLLPCLGRGVRAGLLERRHLLAIAADFARGMLLLLAGLTLLAPPLHWAAGVWGNGVDPLARALLTMFLIFMLAASARLFTGRARLFVVGAAAGLLVQVLR